MSREERVQTRQWSMNWIVVSSHAGLGQNSRDRQSWLANLKQPRDMSQVVALRHGFHI